MQWNSNTLTQYPGSSVTPFSLFAVAENTPQSLHGYTMVSNVYNTKNGSTKDFAGKTSLPLCYSHKLEAKLKYKVVFD